MGFEASESAVALVGMDGFRLLAAAEVDGELHQLVETTATVVGCPGCGTRARSKGRRKVSAVKRKCLGGYTSTGRSRRVMPTPGAHLPS